MRQNQLARVREYIKQRGSISYRAMEVKLRINSPRDVMAELRKVENISSCWVSQKERNEKGEMVTRARYKVFYIEP